MAAVVCEAESLAAPAVAVEEANRKESRRALGFFSLLRSCLLDVLDDRGDGVLALVGIVTVVTSDVSVGHAEASALGRLPDVLRDGVATKDHQRGGR